MQPEAKEDLAEASAPDEATEQPPTEQKETPSQPEVPEGVTIDEDDITLLTESGVEYNKAALALAHGGTVEKALEWLEANPTVEAKKKLSPEEREQKAMELQKRLRERRMAKEKEDEKVKEKQRIESTKALMEAKRAWDEQERKRAVEQMVREREEKRRAEERQRELMAAEYRERFGREPPSQEEVKELEEQKAHPKDRIKIYLGRLKDQAATSESEKQRVLVCLKAVRVYCNNAKTHPTEQKYHQIRLQNAAFQERVAGYPDAIKLLNTVGFIQDGDFLKIKGLIPDGFILGECIKFLDFILDQH